MPVEVGVSGARIEFLIECKGVSGDDFVDIMKDLKKAYPGCRPSVRNPTPPEFDPATIHALLVRIPVAAIGTYAARKLIDKGADILGQLIMKRLARGDQMQKKLVTIYDENGRNVVEVVVKPTVRR
jgi:hypothetical protein